MLEGMLLSSVTHGPICGLQDIISVVVVLRRQPVLIEPLQHH